MNIDEELNKVDPVKALTSGKITSNYIGTTVILSNSAITCQEWIIADVNHDNTSGTVDLISKYTLNNNSITKYSSSSQYYKGSNLDTYLESTVYGGFSSSIKSALNNMNVVSNGETIQRHVVAPSLIELGNSYTDYALEEGTIYPIFSPASNPNAKSAYKTPSGNDEVYWTRSRSTIYTNNVWIVNKGGNVILDSGAIHYSYNGCYVVARIRFAKA